jgi:hypothetical protein
LEGLWSVLCQGSSLERDSGGGRGEGLLLLLRLLQRILPLLSLRLLSCIEGLLLCECLRGEQHHLFLGAGRIHGRGLLLRLKLLLRPSGKGMRELRPSGELVLPPLVLLRRVGGRVRARRASNGRRCGRVHLGAVGVLLRGIHAGRIIRENSNRRGFTIIERNYTLFSNGRECTMRMLIAGRGALSSAVGLLELVVDEDSSVTARSACHG